MTRLAVHKPRDGGDVVLVTRKAAAALLKRHPDQVSRNCEPMACDVKSRLPLYDMDSATRTIEGLRRRVA